MVPHLEHRLREERRRAGRFSRASHSAVPLCPLSHFRHAGLKDDARAFLAKGIGLLRREAHQQTVLLLVLGDVLHDILDGLAHRDTLEGGLAAQLLRHLTLLLQIRDHHVHNQPRLRWARADRNQ